MVKFFNKTKQSHYEMKIKQTIDYSEIFLIQSDWVIRYQFNSIPSSINLSFQSVRKSGALGL